MSEAVTIFVSTIRNSSLNKRGVSGHGRGLGKEVKSSPHQQ